MLRSIRWRLVAVFVLLTLITVSVMGVLGLSLVKRYVEQQETNHLNTNAKAVARQALPLMQPVVRYLELQELARTSALLGNARVRILDARRQVLADSGPRTEAQEFVWIVPRVRLDPNAQDSPYVMMFPPGQPMMIPVPHNEVSFYEQLPPDLRYTVVHREETAWGGRLVFEVREGHLSRVHPAEITAVPPLEAVAEAVAPHSQRLVSAPVGEADSRDSRREPIGYVELSAGSAFGAEALATARQAFLLAGSGAALLAVVVGLLVSQGLAAPLRSLAAAAGQMSSGDLSVRAPVRGKDEIGQLAGQFNHMAERLEASFAELSAERDALRRFIADASHELRTPITVLKTFNELLQSAAADDPPAQAEFLAESQAQLDRLEWITHNLLNLSRFDAGLVDLDLAEHDARELVEAVAATFKPLASEKEISLSTSQAAVPIQARCDRARIEVALSNLVDNAIKLTSAGGKVEIGLEQTGETVQWWVQDNGVGIEPADLPHVFERFYRGRPGQGEGSGLGLAIVQSIVQAHGGRVFAESTPGGGSRFVIELSAGIETLS